MYIIATVDIIQSLFNTGFDTVYSIRYAFLLISGMKELNKHSDPRYDLKVYLHAPLNSDCADMEI